jgi:hypothetical protein
VCWIWYRKRPKRYKENWGSADRRKLEEYLDGLRSVERRIELSELDRHSHHQDAFQEDPLLHADEREVPELLIPAGKGIPSVLR